MKLSDNLTQGDILYQISIAWESHPDLTLSELVEMVCHRRYPTRNTKFYDSDKYDERPYALRVEKWKLTNNDIYQAFLHYNLTRY